MRSIDSFRPAALAAAAACALLATPATAMTHYASVAALEAAAGAPSELFDFNSTPSRPFIFYDVGPFTLRQEEGVCCSTMQFADGNVLVTSSTAVPYTYSITFDAPIIAFGAQYAHVAYGHQNTIEAAGESFAGPACDYCFFGFLGATPFTTVRFSSPDEWHRFDDVRFVYAGGPAPEPAAWALMICGFGLAGATLRRRRPAIGDAHRTAA